MKPYILILTLSLTVLLQACSGSDYSLKNLAKSSINQVIDIHLEELDKAAGQMIIQLYEKNLQELAKNTHTTLENRLVQILKESDASYEEVNHTQSIETINLAWDKNYKNDRVFALMLGINSMLRHSYNNKQELFYLDDIDPQKIYDSARNLEKIMWRLRTESDNGKPLLVLGPAYGRNSFESIVMRIINIQAMVARIIAKENHVTVTSLIHGTAASWLIPIPFLF